VTLLALALSSAAFFGQSQDAAQAPAPTDSRLALNATVVLTPEFCNTTLIETGGAHWVWLPLGKFFSEELDQPLSGIFSSLTRVKETPAPGNAQVVLFPRFLKLAGPAAKTIMTGRGVPAVSMEWTVRDPSGKMVWTGTLQLTVERRLSGLTVAKPLREFADELAAQSAAKIASAPEVRTFAQLLLAKSTPGSTPATAATKGELLQAVRDGDLVKVTAQLKDNPALISSTDANASTPLHLAASSDRKDVAEFLSANHADVSAKDANGATPLHNAAFSGHKDLAELLLANHADVGAKDFKGATPLHYAAEQGHQDVAEVLLAHHADPGAQDLKKVTPLHRAAAQGHKDILELLLASHAEVNAGADNGAMPLHDATFHNHYDAAELLLASHAEENAKSTTGDTPLHNAASFGSKELVTLLLANHADVNARANNGQTPLHRAVLRTSDVLQKYDVVEVLLSNNADIDASDSQGSTPLHVVAFVGLLPPHQKNLAELLLAHHADVNARDLAGATPSHNAASQGHMDIVELLLAYHADVNIQTNKGATPMGTALVMNHPEIAEVLGRHGGKAWLAWSWPEQAAAPAALVLLPAVDARKNNQEKVDLEDMRKYARKQLEFRKYEVVEADTPPPGARWLVTVTLAALGQSGYFPVASVSCSLKDEQTGLIV
jgi:cytohesin